MPTVSFATLLADTLPPARSAGSAKSGPNRAFDEYLTAASASRSSSRPDASPSAQQPTSSSDASRPQDAPADDAEPPGSRRPEQERADGAATPTPEPTSVVAVAPAAPVVVEPVTATVDGTVATPSDGRGLPSGSDGSASPRSLANVPDPDNADGRCAASSCTADGMVRARANGSDSANPSPVLTDEPPADDGGSPPVVSPAVPRPRLQPVDAPIPDGARPPPSEPPRPRPVLTATRLEENLTPVRLDPADPKSQAMRRESLQSRAGLAEQFAESGSGHSSSSDGENPRPHDPRPRGIVVTTAVREAGATFRTALDVPSAPAIETTDAQPALVRGARTNPGVELGTMLVGADAGDVSWTQPTVGRGPTHPASPIATPAGGVDGSVRIPWLGSQEAAAAVESMPGVDRLAETLGSTAGNRSWRVALRLDPPELGQVLVHARWSEGKLSLRVQTEDDSVRQMVDARMSELRDALSRRGIRLDAADVQLGTSHDRGSTYRETDGGRSDGRPSQSQDSPGGQASHRQADGEGGRGGGRHPQPAAESAWAAGRAGFEADIASEGTYTAMDLVA